MKNKRMIYLGILVMVLFCMTWTLYAANGQGSDDWEVIWQKPIPAPETVETEQLGKLGSDLENRKWLMVSTDYHQIYYQPSADKGKVAEVYYLIDNIYKFLEGRSPAKLKPPIKAFLVPNERGRSRCDRTSNAMRTGEQGDVLFIMTSLLHEETHLFNFAFLNGVPQGWWAGEYYCQYFQQRALWKGQGRDIKREIISRMPNGPQYNLNQLDKHGKKAFDEALSALYFFEEKYGPEKSKRFRQASLEESKITKGGSLPGSVFVKVFGKDVNRLEQEWLQFYGWGSIEKGRSDRTPDLRLNMKISYAVDKASVQNVVLEMANKAGLQYNWTKSQSEAGSLCRRWVRNVNVKEQPLHEALRGILDPIGLSYKLEENAIVLYKK